jgi:hypothetical protein
MELLVSLERYKPVNHFLYPFGIFKLFFRNATPSIRGGELGFFMMFNSTFNNITVISRRAVLLVEKT